MSHLQRFLMGTEDSSLCFGVLIDLQRNEHKLGKGWASPNSLKPRNCGQTQDIRRISSKATLGTSKNFRHWKGEGGGLKKETSKVWRWKLINPSTQKTEAGRSPGVPSRSTYKVLGQSRLQSKTLSPKQTNKQKNLEKQIRMTKNGEKEEEEEDKGKKFRSRTSQL